MGTIVFLTELLFIASVSFFSASLVMKLKNSTSQFLMSLLLPIFVFVFIHYGVCLLDVHFDFFPYPCKSRYIFWLPVTYFSGAVGISIGIFRLRKIARKAKKE